jgi:hypothetical protein
MKRTTSARLPKDKVVVYLDPLEKCPYSRSFERRLSMMGNTNKILIHKGGKRTLKFQGYPHWFAGTGVTKGRTQDGHSMEGLREVLNNPPGRKGQVGGG